MNVSKQFVDIFKIGILLFTILDDLGNHTCNLKEPEYDNWWRIYGVPSIRMWMTVIEIVGLVFCGSRVIVSPDVTCDNLSGQNSEDGNKLKRKPVVTSVGQQKKSIAFVVFCVNQETPCTGNVRKSSLESSAYT